MYISHVGVQRHLIITRKQIEKTYTGNFSITVNPSALTNEQDIVNNPLGLFVTDFSVSEENK